MPSTLSSPPLPHPIISSPPISLHPTASLRPLHLLLVTLNRMRMRRCAASAALLTKQQEPLLPPQPVGLSFTVSNNIFDERVSWMFVSVVG